MPRDMSTRVARLHAALTKAQAKLKKAKGAEAKKRYTDQIMQYTASLANIEEFGEETPPTGNPVGVEIGVPKAGK